MDLEELQKQREVYRLQFVELNNKASFFNQKIKELDAIADVEQQKYKESMVGKCFNLGTDYNSYVKILSNENSRNSFKGIKIRTYKYKGYERSFEIEFNRTIYDDMINGFNQEFAPVEISSERFNKILSIVIGKLNETK